MISVATTFDLDRSPFSSFPMEIPRVSSAASPDPESRASLSIDLSLSVHGFKTGDMVWGKVKSHPWWPGFIYNEALATPSVRRSRQENHVLVAFFGDSSYGWFDPSELIPFSPNFPEMSKQTTLRSFLIAVDEAVDEFSRRAALGLTCRCRNPRNFRPRKVPNHFAVDVPGFERGGIYSVDQIVRSREEFVPGDSLTFVRQLALAPYRADASDVEWTKRSSVVLAYRGATYEEFDVPYAEAFGVQLERQAHDSPKEEPEKIAPRVGPFSGPLVNNNKNKHSSSSAAIFPPSASKKKKKKKKNNKYLLKKRDGDPSSTSPLALPDGYSQQTVLFHTPLPPLQDTKTTIRDDDELSTAPLVETETPVSSLPALSVTEPPAVLVDHKPPPDDSKGGGIGGGSEPSTEGKVTKDKAKKKKKKKQKRPREEEDDVVVKEKNIEELLYSKKHSVGIEDSQPELMRTPGPDVPAISGPKIDVGPDPLEFPVLLGDLKVFATEPHYGVDRVVGDVFLKFRSLVYAKSLVPPLASETGIVSLTKERKEQSEKTPNVKIGSLFNRSSDPAKANKKRMVPLSDRQEEVSVKRLRKSDQLKSFATPPPPVCLKDVKNAVPTPAKPSSSADLASRKRTREELPLLPLPPKKPSPTNLILKFPPRSTLPSIPNLKARFARFGQLVVDRCRVNWDTHSCRVQYKYKADALEAYDYAKDNNMFGQVPVKYIVREVELPSSKPERLRPDPQPESSVQFMPGNGNSPTQSARPKYNQPKLAPLKSILKKPGEDVVKENQRVKFKLAGDVSKPEMPSAAISVGLPKFPLTATPTQPPPASSLRHRPFNESRTLPLRSQVQLRSPAPPPITRQEVQQQYGGGSGEENKNSSPEVSRKMLSMLHRCNDIVTVLRSLPGFSLYRPL